MLRSKVNTDPFLSIFRIPAVWELSLSIFRMYFLSVPFHLRGQSDGNTLYTPVLKWLLYLLPWCISPWWARASLGLHDHTQTRPVSVIGPPHSWGFYITINDAPQSVGLLWTSDRYVPQTYTLQHTTFTIDKHLCLRCDSNPQSQQVSGRRTTP